MRATLASLGRAFWSAAFGRRPSYAYSTFTAASATGTADGATGNTHTLTVRSTGNAVMPNVAVTFTTELTAVSASQSTVDVTPSTIDNDGVDTAVVTVTAKNAAGVALPNIAASRVVVAATGTGNTLTQPSAASSKYGQSTGSIVSTVAATKVLSATIDGVAITDTASLTVSAGYAGNDEPTFTGGDTDLLASIGLDGTFASTIGWVIGGDAGASGTVQAAGTGFSGGASKAVRLVWPSNSAPTQPNAYIESSQWAASAHIFTTFRFKLVAGNITDSADHSGIKWLLFRRTPDDGDATDGRITWGLNSLVSLCTSVASGAADGGIQFSSCDQNDGNGVLQNITRSIGWSTTSVTRTTNVANGAYHRATYEADTVNNFRRIWLDGVLVHDSTGFTPNMPNAGFKAMEWGHQLVGASDGFTVDFSDISVWSRP